MKFIANSRRRAKEYENALVDYWKENKTFEKSVAKNPVENSYVFYDGPPFITGVPHHGTLLSSIIKDAVPRYQTMRGKRVERVWGWDCHGLPAENFVEKQLGIVDRRQIVTDENAPAPLDKDGNELPTITLEKYIETARESMTENSESWEPVIDRIGRWVDFKGAYRTMDRDFMESVWWAFAKLYEAGKIYEGEKVLMYDTKFATPVSKNEVTMDNDAYQTVTDPSAFAKFAILRESGKPVIKNGLPMYFLAWTTTPWTLPGNTALAVNPEMTYSEVRVGEEIFVMAKELLAKVLTDEKNKPIESEIIESEIPGAKLVGRTYEPIVPIPSGMASNPVGSRNDNAGLQSEIYKVWAADYVSAESGTGIVHIAPMYGEEDYELAKLNNIPGFNALDDNGIYYDPLAQKLYEMMPWLDAQKPLEVWESNKHIAKGLKLAGKVWKIEYIQHEYPFNPRSKQRIMYRAIPSWFFDVQGSKPLLISQNENINWFPPHLKHGRFAKNIEQAPDWNLSRDRFWATAMPVWKSESGKIKVVGSYAELYELSGVKLDDYHRPWVDDITFQINGETYTRIDKVLDCWFESGSMPFAQLHYPFENAAKFEANYPADFIVEYIGQVRAWFYYVHVVNTALAECGAFGDVSQPAKLKYESHDGNLYMMLDISDKVRALNWPKNIGNLELKNEFHVTLAKIPTDLGDELLSQIQSVAEENENVFANANIKITDEFLRLVDEDRDRETVIALLDLPDVEIWRAAIREVLADAKFAIPHTTLYTNGCPGISFNAESRGRLVREIDEESLATLRNAAQKHMNAYKNVITTGVVAGNDGRKMSKSLGNFTDPTLLMDEYSADSLRFLLLSSPLLNGEDFSLKDKDVGDVARKLSMIWNMYDFFTMYASVDGWEWSGDYSDPSQNLKNPLDKWIVSRLHELIAEVGEHMDAYDLAAATKPILPFIDDASNWFVRRSRRRFWKSEDDGDKNDAYKTLHYVLVQLAHVIAPFTPFLAEELYQKLTGGESVHLRNWPEVGAIDEKVLDDMGVTRQIINTGLAIRMGAANGNGGNRDEVKIKARQPLAKVTYSGLNEAEARLDSLYEQIIAEELNVKAVDFYDNEKNGEPEGFAALNIWLDKSITPELQREGQMREVIRVVQSARKAAGLNVDDRIKLLLNTDDAELKTAVDEHYETIANEVLAVEIVEDMIDEMYETVAKIDGAEIKIALIIAA